MISLLKRLKNGSALRRKPITTCLRTRSWGYIRITHGTGGTDFVIFLPCLSSMFFALAARLATNYSLFSIEPRELRFWSRLAVSEFPDSNMSRRIRAVMSLLQTIHLILSPVLGFCTIYPMSRRSFAKWRDARRFQVIN